MKAFILIFIFLFSVKALWSVQFSYVNETGRILRFKNLVRYSVIVNGEPYGSMDEMNKVVLELQSLSNQWGFYSGKFSSFSRDINLADSYKLNEEYLSSFYQDEQGVQIVWNSSLLPTTRSIPTFPTNDLKIGDTWSAPGEEVHRSVLNTNTVFRVKVEPAYRYLGNETIDGRLLARIAIDYHIQYFPRKDPDMLSFTGYTHNTLYWDISNRMPYFYFEEFAFMYTARTGETIFYKGLAESKVEYVSDLTNQKQQVFAELSNSAGHASNGMTVRETNDGIIVNLGNILFDINKATIKKEFETRLDKLAEILRKYPRLDIAVSGHTDIIGTAAYNQSLSEARAKAISDYLISKGINPTRISFKGYGSLQPVADNTSEDGRTKNRRVEIKIITRE